MTNTKYNVGDKVRVRSDMGVYENSGDYVFISAMEKFMGQTVTIAKCHSNHYSIEEDDDRFFWTDEMFEGLVEEETHMTAEELLTWLTNNYYDADLLNTLFGSDLSIDEFADYGVSKIISKIEAYEKGKQKIETEFRYVFRIIENKDGVKRCVDERIVCDDILSIEQVDEICSKYLKEYCSTHNGGDFFCTYGRNCYVRE